MRLLTNNPHKYQCHQYFGQWCVHYPRHVFIPSQMFPSFDEAILHIRAHLRIDALGMPRG